ncbi:MAG: hypothetical protein AB1646_12265 [Thermodesulfobacteriota bacterium]
MISFRRIVLPVSLFGALLLCGCNAEVSELKDKLAAMEKRLAKQDKLLGDFEKKFSVPKDFSVDIQRLEDEQEKVRELIKNKVEPVHRNLGELRDWAREVEEDRPKTAEKIKQVEQFQHQAITAIEGSKKEIERLGKELAEGTARTQKVVKVLQEQEKSLVQFGKSLKQLENALQQNNNQILAAVKKTLPKVKEAAVTEIKKDMEQLEKRIRDTHTASEQKAPPEGLHMPGTPASSRQELGDLRKKVKELEEVVASQQAELLKMGGDLHKLQVRLQRQAGAMDDAVVSQAPHARNERARRER